MHADFPQHVEDSKKRTDFTITQRHHSKLFLPAQIVLRDEANSKEPSAITKNAASGNKLLQKRKNSGKPDSGVMGIDDETLEEIKKAGIDPGTVAVAHQKMALKQYETEQKQQLGKPKKNKEMVEHRKRIQEAKDELKLKDWSGLDTSLLDVEKQKQILEEATHDRKVQDEKVLKDKIIEVIRLQEEEKKIVQEAAIQQQQQREEVDRQKRLQEENRLHKEITRQQKEEEAARQKRLQEEKLQREEAAREKRLQEEKYQQDEAARQKRLQDEKYQREEAARQKRLQKEKFQREEAAREKRLQEEKYQRDEAARQKRLQDEKYQREEAAREKRLQEENRVREEVAQQKDEEAGRQKMIQGEAAHQERWVIVQQSKNTCKTYAANKYDDSDSVSEEYYDVPEALSDKQESSPINPVHVPDYTGSSDSNQIINQQQDNAVTTQPYSDQGYKPMWSRDPQPSRLDPKSSNDNPHNLEVGSMIQFGNPPCYGVIKWMGTLPETDCVMMAGVEVVSCI